MKSETDVDQCKDLVTRFYRHLDRREFGALDRLMARDGCYVRPPARRVAAGADLVADLEKGSTTASFVHLASNLTVDIEGDEALVMGYLVAFQHDDGSPRKLPMPLHGPFSIRELNIRLHRREDAWRIGLVDNTLLFKQA